MYCETCQTDVAAEIAPSGKALLCTTCGGEVRRTETPSLSSEAQSARELLDRWSRDELLDPYGPADESADSPAPRQKPAVQEPAAQKPTPKLRIDDGVAGVPVSGPRTPRPPAAGPKRPHFRIDAAQTPGSSSPATEALDAAMAAPPTQTGQDGPPAPPMTADGYAAMPDGYRVDARHAVPAPHLPVEAFAPESGPKPGRFESLAGQLLAYGGVALLTVGTSLVLFGYFGGPTDYTATGWLVATIGQMLLFLGVVTLISGGMQQTTHEVGSRVQYLGDRLVRLESRQPLAGPHYARQTADQRQTSPVSPQAAPGD